jgi:hypothetical protein
MGIKARAGTWPTASGEAACRRQRRRLWFVAALQHLLLGLFLLGCAPLAQAQLAQSFVNVTRITTRQLPNAVQVRIETDGSAPFGTDLSDFIDFDAGFVPKPTQSLRIRILRARAKLPTFVPIEAYPIDGAVISLGTEVMENPNFSDYSGGTTEPRVQIELRFAAPVIVREFEKSPGDSIDFGGILGPLEARVEPSNDRRAIVITVITNRADATIGDRLNRSPLAGRGHKLSVTGLQNGHFRVEALHTPLREVLDGLAGATSTHFLTRDPIATLEVSLVLPDTTLTAFLEALQLGYGIGWRDEDGTTVLGRGAEFFPSRALPLQNLTPEKARLLFPDFLLPSLRAERENNSLIAVQTPQLLDKISSDLAILDTPRPQFEIRVAAWEIATTRELNQTLALTRSVGGDIETLNLGTGTASVRVENGITDRLEFALSALASKGRAKLVAAPYVTALSGEAGNLFLGQTRYIKVLQNRGGGQTAQALPLQIGTTLGVTPRGNDDNGEILLNVTPRVSTVDEIEPRTGLPILGIREASSLVRVKPDESIVLAGLDFNYDATNAGRAFKVLPTRRESREKRALLVLVHARRVGSSAPAKTDHTLNQATPTPAPIPGTQPR